MSSDFAVSCYNYNTLWFVVSFSIEERNHHANLQHEALNSSFTGTVYKHYNALKFLGFQSSV